MYGSRQPSPPPKALGRKCCLPSSTTTPEGRRQQARAERHRSRARGGPDLPEVMSRVDGVGRQAIDLGLVEQQEEGARPVDAVIRVGQVQLSVALPRLPQRRQAVLGALVQHVELAELDRVRGTRLCAGGLLVVLQAVVAERALPHAAVVLALVEHPERTRWDAVAAAVTDVLLNHHRPEFGPEQGSRRTDLEAGGVGAVLAHVRGHQPAQAVALLVGVEHPMAVARRGRGLRHVDERRAVRARVERKLLLYEGHVAPGVGAQIQRVVVGLAAEPMHRHRDLVPLLARHLAGLAPDADRCVGEEADAAHVFTPARRRYSSTSSRRARPRGRRPGLMSQVATLYSEMWTLLSSASGSRSLALSPVTIPTPPQW